MGWFVGLWVVTVTCHRVYECSLDTVTEGTFVILLERAHLNKIIITYFLRSEKKRITFDRDLIKTGSL